MYVPQLQLVFYMTVCEGRTRTHHMFQIHAHVWVILGRDGVYKAQQQLVLQASKQ